VIAAVGLVANVYVALTLRGESHRHGPSTHRHEDLNMRSAFLQVVGDALSSVGVILAAGLIYLTGMTWFDPLISVLIGLMILLGSGRLARRALHILIEGTPEGIKLSDIGQVLAEAPGVHEVHDLHVWSLCSGQISLSAHIIMERDTNMGQGLMLMELNRRLNERFGIEHTTLQLEPAHASQGQLLMVQ
jgi:cobalt-zinc-cadmium efflux system protein